MVALCMHCGNYHGARPCKGAINIDGAMRIGHTFKGTTGKTYNELLEEIELQSSECKRLVAQLDAVTAERDALKAALRYLAAGVEHSEASLLYQEVRKTEGIDPDTSFSMEYTYLQNALSNAKGLLEVTETRLEVPRG